MTNDPDRYFKAIDQTWPASAYVRRDGWLLRDGRGGGKRVSAASRLERDATLDSALDWFDGRNETPLFMIGPKDADLDQSLGQQGYSIVDPTDLLSIDPNQIAEETEVLFQNSVSVEARQIWEQGGIGQARIDVMERAKGPKFYMELPKKAVGFFAVSDAIAMVHALEVSKHARRQGCGAMLMKAAAFQAKELGAGELVVLTVKANQPAQSLYRNFGFRGVSQYHYRLASG